MLAIGVGGGRIRAGQVFASFRDGFLDHPLALTALHAAHGLAPEGTDAPPADGGHSGNLHTRRWSNHRITGGQILGYPRLRIRTEVHLVEFRCVAGTQHPDKPRRGSLEHRGGVQNLQARKCRPFEFGLQRSLAYGRQCISAQELNAVVKDINCLRKGEPPSRPMAKAHALREQEWSRVIPARLIPAPVALRGGHGQIEEVNRDDHSILFIMTRKLVEKTQDLAPHPLGRDRAHGHHEFIKGNQLIAHFWDALG